MIRKISRVGRPEDVIFAVKKMEATSVERFVTKNVVYREVLLHRRRPPPPQVDPVPNPAAILLETDHSPALDYLSIYDNMEEEEDDQPREERRIHQPATALPTPSLSATLPTNVTLAPLPTVREAEVFSFKKNLGELENHPTRLQPTWRVSKLLTRLGWPP